MGKIRQAQKLPGRVRIIGGQWRGRRLPVPAAETLRPTPDRVRETLFNWLQPVISGARCLDLYAGTGILGLEAVSRGAAGATLVEQNGALVAQLRHTAAMLKAGDTVRIEQADAQQWLRHATEAFDVVFLDPPFGQGLIARSARLLQERGCLRAHALVYMESEPDVPLPGGFRAVREGKAGKVKYLLAELL